MERTFYIQKGMKDGQIDKTKNAEAMAFALFTLYSGLRVLAKIEENKQKLMEMVHVGLSILD